MRKLGGDVTPLWERRTNMTDRTDARMTDLEVRYTYLERLVRDLDQVVIELRAEIARLERVVSETKELPGGVHHSAADTGNPGEDRDRQLADEKPPHY